MKRLRDWFLNRVMWCVWVGRCRPTVILTRHADVPANAGSDPALNAAGQTRAQELVHVLQDASIEAIFVSQFQRTQQTAAPVAASLGLTPVAHTSVTDLAAAVRAQSRSSTVLVVGHSNTVPELIAALGGPSGLTIASTEFDRLFVLTRDRLIALRYGA